jgi:hypothetical protein
VARKSYIETGMAYQGMSEVVNGLNIDERVIVAGYNQISDGSPVRIAK